MKKILSILFSFVMVLMLVSCKSNETKVVESTEAVSNETESTEVVASSDVNEIEAEEELGDTVDAVTLIHPQIKEHYQSAQDDMNIFVYEIIWPEINLKDDEIGKYSGLQASFDELNTKWKEDTQNSKMEFLENYEYVLEDGRELIGIMTDKNTISMVRSDSNYTSVLKTYDWFGGGAHGGYGYSGYNFDSKTGKQVILEDIIANKDELISTLKDKLKKDYSDVGFFDLDGYLDEYTLNDLDPDEMHFKFTWTLGYDSLTIYFGQYELAPYACGIQVVKLPFEEYKGLFNDVESLKRVPNSYVESIPTTWDDNGYKTNPYVAKYNGNIYTLNFKELDDEEAVVDILDSTQNSVSQLKGRLTKTVADEEVEGPVDGLHIYQCVHTCDAFVDPEKFTIEYFDKTNGKSIIEEYSLGDIVN